MQTETLAFGLTVYRFRICGGPTPNQGRPPREVGAEKDMNAQPLSDEPIHVNPSAWQNPHSRVRRYAMSDLAEVVRLHVDRRYSAFPALPEEGEDPLDYTLRAFPAYPEVGDHVPHRWNGIDADGGIVIGIMLRQCFISYGVVFDDPKGETFLLTEEWGPGVTPA